MIFLATKNSRIKKILPHLFGAVVGSGIWDPRWIKIRIWIRDKHPGSATLHTTGFSHIVQQQGKNAAHTRTTETENAAHLSLLQENAFQMTSRQLLDFRSFFLETLAALEQENCASVP